MPPSIAVDVAAIKSGILSLLPLDGTPVLNRVMRVMLARKLEHVVDEDIYFKARDALLAKGLIGRLRGQGGQLFLAKDTGELLPPVSLAAEFWSEAKLMAPLKAYLEGSFRKNLDLPAEAAFIVKDTSAIGHRGRWARPDFILVSAMRFRLLPGAQVDLHSFELKTESGGSLLAIHEALAQTRFTHFGHFVWHLPGGSKSEAMLDDIIVHCEDHGIGLIRMRDPERPDLCEILLDPKRKPTLSATVDDFLDLRLNDAQKRVISAAIGGPFT